MASPPPPRFGAAFLLGAGLAVLLSGNTTACSGGSSTGSCDLCGEGTGGFTEGAVGSNGGGNFGAASGTTGSAVQYCGVSDGGIPVPCPDAGLGGTGHAGDGG